jgi:hypothetical protein
MYFLEESEGSLIDLKTKYDYGGEDINGLNVTSTQQMAKSYSRGRKPRRDTIERVALARFLLENREVDTATVACVRVRVPILKELFYNLYNIICLYHILKH